MNESDLMLENGDLLELQRKEKILKSLKRKKLQFKMKLKSHWHQASWQKYLENQKKF